MSRRGDQRLRELERRWRHSGRVEDESAYLRELLRRGELDPVRLEVAAFVEHPAALRAADAEGLMPPTRASPKLARFPPNEQAYWLRSAQEVARTQDPPPMWAEEIRPNWALGLVPYGLPVLAQALRVWEPELRAWLGPGDAAASLRWVEGCASGEVKPYTAGPPFAQRGPEDDWARALRGLRERFVGEDALRSVARILEDEPLRAFWLDARRLAAFRDGMARWALGRES